MHRLMRVTNTGTEFVRDIKNHQEYREMLEAERTDEYFLIDENGNVFIPMGHTGPTEIPEIVLQRREKTIRENKIDPIAMLATINQIETALKHYPETQVWVEGNAIAVRIKRLYESKNYYMEMVRNGDSWTITVKK